MSSITKAELISIVAERTGSSKASTSRFLDALQETIVENVSNGVDVKLSGFAAFEKTERTGRTTKHPKTGEPLEVPGFSTVKIRPLKSFKESIRKS